MTEISLNTDIIFEIKTHCLLCGDTLDANITVDSHMQVIDISIDPNHSCLTAQINEINEDVIKAQRIHLTKG